MSETFTSTLLQMLVLLPATASCMLCARDYRRFAPRKTTILASSTLLATALLLAWAHAFLQLPLWIAGIFAAIALLAVFCLLTTLDRARILAIYVGILAIETFPLQFALCFDAHLHPESGAADISVSAAALQLVFAITLMVAFAYPASHAFASLLDELDMPRVWYLAVFVSAIFLGGNLAVIPLHYQTLYAGRLDDLFPWLEAGGMVLLIVIYLLFYRGAHLILESARLRERAQIFEREAHQYQTLRTYMDETARLRHDFRHSVRVLNALAQKGDLPTLRQYLASYEQQVQDAPVLNLCRNSALDALFGYYASLAASESTPIRWDLSLPDPLPFSELAMSSLFGNLLDNALQASLGVPEEQRQICLTATVRGDSLYVVCTNTFDGTVRKDKRGYLSAKHIGRGTGLASICAVAEQNGGYAHFSNDNHEFFADIALRLPGADPNDVT